MYPLYVHGCWGHHDGSIKAGEDVIPQTLTEILTKVVALRLRSIDSGATRVSLLQMTPTSISEIALPPAHHQSDLTWFPDRQIKPGQQQVILFITLSISHHF